MTGNCSNKKEVTQHFHQYDMQELEYENKRGFPRRRELHRHCHKE